MALSSYLICYDVATDFPTLKRVTIAICRVVIAVQAEAVASVTVPAGSTMTQQQLHFARSALAYAVLHDPTSYARLFAFSAAGDDSIAANTTDAQLQTLIAAQWNAFAVNGA
ncbi:MAG: hypothetical protein LC130_23215 [Bryobacterales bacterium]|nr:hypothetical protein [Bryobacterales bacterium]